MQDWENPPTGPDANVRLMYTRMKAAEGDDFSIQYSLLGPTVMRFDWNAFKTWEM